MILKSIDSLILESKNNKSDISFIKSKKNEILDFIYSNKRLFPYPYWIPPKYRKTIPPSKEDVANAIDFSNMTYNKTDDKFQIYYDTDYNIFGTHYIVVDIKDKKVTNVFT